jgi:hypothetical protein
LEGRIAPHYPPITGAFVGARQDIFTFAIALIQAPA